jgi:hypothetical protein
MDLVDIGHGAAMLGEIGDLPDRGDVAVHRVKALEDDQLRAVPGFDQQLFRSARDRFTPSIMES